MVEKAKKQGSFVSPPVATISESSGIPKRKYFPQACETELRPLFTGQVFIVAEGLLAADSRGATGGRGWHVHQPMAQRAEGLVVQRERRRYVAVARRPARW